MDTVSNGDTAGGVRSALPDSSNLTWPNQSLSAKAIMPWRECPPLSACVRRTPSAFGKARVGPPLAWLRGYGMEHARSALQLESGSGSCEHYRFPWPRRRENAHEEIHLRLRGPGDRTVC